MTLNASTYFKHLQAYVNTHYVIAGSKGSVILSEKYYRMEDEMPQKRTVKLRLPGDGMAFKLDYEGSSSSKRNRKPPLFHFLDDISKPWSKRCDFVVFYVNNLAFHADCIEFKSKSLNHEKIVPQLKAGVSWVNTLKCTIEHYTGDKRKFRLRKFIFGENVKPEAYLDSNRQLKADPSIRYYHFDEVHGQMLSDLNNASVQDI